MTSLTAEGGFFKIHLKYEQKYVFLLLRNMERHDIFCVYDFEFLFFWGVLTLNAES